MYPIPGTYFHPWLHPRRCETEAELLDLLALDEHWRDTVYTEPERHRLRMERAEKEKHERAVMHAALVDKARFQAALRDLQANLGEGVRIIDGYRYRRAIVIYPGRPMANVHTLHNDGLLHWRDSVPVEDVRPDGSIRLPEPLSPVTGHYAWSTRPPSISAPPAALDLEGDEWHALPSQDSAPPPTPPRRKGGRPPLSKREIARFQRMLKDTVLKYVGQYGTTDMPTMTEIQQRLPGKTTEATWRKRYDRTMEEWHCATWEDIFLYILNTRT